MDFASSFNSNEVKKKMINEKLAKRYCKEDLSTEHTRLHMKGKTVTNETRRKMSEAKKGKTNSAEHRRKISESMKGIVRSEDTRKKMSEAKKGLLKNKTWKIINGKRVWLSKEG